MELKKLTFLFKRIWTLNYISLFKTIAKIHKKTKLKRIWLFTDMLYCAVHYGAGYRDYELCEFYNLTHSQRSTYVTRGINNNIVKLLNDHAYTHCMEDKAEFNTLFSAYIKRGWLNLKTASFKEFTAFMEQRNQIIAKPLDESCGKGVEKLSKNDFSSIQILYKHLNDNNIGIIEDYIIQHHDLSAIYPNSVNTYRIVTVLSENKSNVVYAFIRIGNGGRFVDNINAGGMAAPIDINTGIIQYPAFDKNSIYYETHPMTGLKFVGYQLPYWKESLEMCLSAAYTIPQLGYVGWDIAVSETGPQLIEGNPFPGHDILQMPPHVPDKIGMLPRFKEFIKEL